MIVALSLVGSTTMRENPISKSIWVWWAMGFERDVDRREPLRHGSMKLSFMSSKRKLCQYGRSCSWKNEEQLATLVRNETSWFWQLIQQIWPFYKIRQVASRKVLSFYGDRQPLSAENFALYFDMIDAQLLITDSEKPKKRLESFLLAWLKRHTGLPLLTPAFVWALVRSARNRRFTFMSMSWASK